MFHALALIATLSFALVTTGCPGGLSERLEDYAQDGAPAAPAVPSSAPASSDDPALRQSAENAARVAAAAAALNARGLSVIAADALPQGRYHLVRVSWSCGESMPESVRIPSQYTGAFQIMARRTLVMHDGHCQDAEGATGGWRVSTTAERRLLRADPVAWSVLPAYADSIEAPVLGAAPVDGGGVIFLEYRYIGRPRAAH
jgi:hypothetical protein